MPESELVFSRENPAVSKLRELGQTISDLGSVQELLFWDQETYMPCGAARARGEHLATLAVIDHEKKTDIKIGTWLSRAEDEIVSGRVYTLADRALVREMRRDYDRETKIPSRLVEDLALASAKGMASWKRARDGSNFGIFKPDLERLVALKIERAQHIGGSKNTYDVLLDEYEPGLTGAEIRAIFEPLSRELPELIRKFGREEPLGKRFLSQHADMSSEEQNAFALMLDGFCREVLEAMGFDFQKGRFDTSVHPFTCSFYPTDVRITTRYHEPWFTSSIFSAIHEGGHGLYDQGIDPDLARTAIGTGASLGIHESQSRLWENMIGRSGAFWQFWHPKLMEAFLRRRHYFHASLENFLRYINQVNPGFIRVDADEVTYNLHIMVRFEVEAAIFARDIQAGDIPAFWNERMERYLGIKPKSDARGCLQDMHWADGSFGYFPTYTIGNLAAAQLMNTIRGQFSDFDSRIASGEMFFLREWLGENVHRWGSVYEPRELILKVTGEPLNPAYFVKYLKDKMDDLFG